MTKAQTLVNLELPEALSGLNKAREEKNYQSPCQPEPWMWDGVDVDDTNDLRTAAKRLDAALTGCLSCEVFNECLSVRDAVLSTATENKVDVSGMIAGQFIDTTKTGDTLRYWLDNGEWPEGTVLT